MRANTQLLPAIVGLALLASATAHAQINDDGFREAAVESFGLEPEEERSSVVEETVEAVRAMSASELEGAIDIAVIERNSAAVSRLVALVQGTPVNDSNRAEYMFRLAELYYQNGRAYEQRAFNRRDEATELQETNPQRARAYLENAAADLEQSDSLAQEAILLYADIYEMYASTYPDIDAVLYYLGANMLQIEQRSGARTIFEELALNYPRSEYLPQARLMLGELEFDEQFYGDALVQYEAVLAFPASSAYVHALYKRAWCLHNIAETPSGIEEALQALYDAVAFAESDPNLSRLRRDALRDMVLFYSEVYPADVAYEFFSEIAPDMAFDLIARLASIYGERGSYGESNTLYRDLIALNSESFEIVTYQREIVRNTRPEGTPEEIVQETRRLMSVFESARSFPDAEASAVTARANDIELLLRQLATTYHREAQTTQNEQLYALAYELYEDYVENFSGTEHAYTMLVYFGDLLYRREEWLRAAEAYDAALSLSQAEGQYDTEATYAACHAYMKMVEVDAAAESSGAASAGEDDLPPVPEPQEIAQQYLRMMTACDRYLATSPTIEDAVQIEYVVAYMYYRFDHLAEAVPRFGQIAMNYNNVDSQRAQVAAELLLDSLALQRRFSEMKEWIDTFKATPALNTGTFASRLMLLSEQVDFKQCRDLQLTDQNEEAGYCYTAFVETHFESTLVDRALYNAAIAFENADMLDFSLSVNDYLIQYRPTSDLVPDTLYELGRTYHRMAMYGTAAGYYEQYVAAAPDGTNVRNALINASQFRSGLGEYSQAIADLRTFIRVADDDDPEQRAAIAEATFQIARVTEQSGDERGALTRYEEFIDDHASTLPGRALEAHIHIANLHAGRDANDRAYQWYERTLAFWDSIAVEERAALSLPAREAAAQSQFMLGERIFVRFEAVPLRGTEAEVQAALSEKIAIGAEAAQVYQRVFEFGPPGWAIAAFTRLGQLYHVFYEQVIDTPIPTGLTLLQTEVYQEQLESTAAAQKEEAMVRYARAVEIARETGYFSEFAARAAELYGQLDPTFKAGTEVRVSPGSDTVMYYQAPFVVELPEEEEQQPMDGSASTTSDDDTTDSASADAVEG